jgi:hypothetical protein
MLLLFKRVYSINCVILLRDCKMNPDLDELID